MMLFSSVLKVLELRGLYLSVRASVRACVRPSAPAEAFFFVRVPVRENDISEDHLRKNQYLSAGIVKTPHKVDSIFLQMFKRTR